MQIPETSHHSPVNPFNNIEASLPVMPCQTTLYESFQVLLSRSAVHAFERDCLYCHCHSVDIQFRTQPIRFPTKLKSKTTAMSAVKDLRFFKGWKEISNSQSTFYVLPIDYPVVPVVQILQPAIAELASGAEGNVGLKDSKCVT